MVYYTTKIYMFSLKTNNIIYYVRFARDNFTNFLQSVKNVKRYSFNLSSDGRLIFNKFDNNNNTSDTYRFRRQLTVIKNNIN